MSVIATKWMLAGLALTAATTAALWAGASSEPLLPACSTLFKAAHHGGTRDPRNLRLIVIHSTEGATARGAAGWFADDASAGSAHMVVDDQECYRTLPDDVVPWGAMGGDANERGLHIEIAGFARDNLTTGHKAFTRQDWLDHIMRLKKAALIVWAWGQKYDIPMRFVDANGLRRGESGVTTHAEITKAWRAGDHVDPGEQFPIDVMMRLLGSNAYGYVA